MNRLQEFLDNPHIITGTATVAADPQLTLIAANKALYTLVGETAESCRQQGNSLLPWIEQSSAVRLIGLLAGHPPLFDWEGVLVRKDATSVRIRLSGTRMEGVLHKGQYPVYLSAFTDLACVEEMLRSAEYERRKYALIADISEDLPFEYDFETDTIAYTQKYHKVFGHEPVIPRFRERLGRGEAIDPVSEGFREPFLALDAEKASTEAAPERFLPTHSGRKRWFALYSTNILDTLGKPVKSVGALRDIDRQKREQLRLLDKSRTDSMTGLYNKVTTEEEIRIALRDARPGSSGVLFMIDIDNFKDVNDSMGHLAGDSIIMEIARQLRRTFRQDDIIGRVGGDEFHVYMRDVSEIAGIRTRAQSLCSSIRNLFKNSNIDNAVSVSVGIAVTERPIAYEDLFRQADVALYHAKGNGKNRYEFFGQSSGGDADGVQTSAPLAVNTVRNSIMVDIIDILFSMYDMHEGIDKALHFIGNALRVDKILIFEYSLDGKAVSIAHEWCSDPKWSTKEQLQNVPIDENRAAQNTGLQRRLLLQRFFGSPPGRKNVHPRRHHLLAPPVRHRARRARGRPYRLRGARQPPHMDAAGSGRPHPHVQNHRGVHPAAPLRQPFARKLRIHPQHPQQPAQYGGLRHRRQPPHRLLQRYGTPARIPMSSSG